MNAKINIRKATSGDFEALARVHHLAIHQGATAYTMEQRRAWSPAQKTADEMAQRLNGQSVFLGETEENDLMGFLTLANGGYVDFAYILPRYRGAGLFRALLSRVEMEARLNWLPRLHTHASLHARPAFAAMGFQVIRPETISIGQVWLPRFAMEKRL
ncbi:MAG: GNAT family N-acetyltransferase [Pseudomonadota bacterium]